MPPRALRFSARPEGNPRHGPSLRSASWMGPSAAMARVRLSTPLRLRLRRGACGVSMGVEAPMLRNLTCRGCLNEAPQARSEFCGTPRKQHDAGLPRSAAKGSQTWGRVLCLLSCTSKKGGRPPGRVPASDIQKEELPTQHQQYFQPKNSKRPSRAFCASNQHNRSVPEMPHPRKHHGHTALVRRIDHLLVTHRSTRLCHAGSTRIHNHIQTITEREEGVARHHGVL